MLLRRNSNFKVCLDLDHGDIETQDLRDLSPSNWISEFGNHIGMLHLKQTTKDRRKNLSFTAENNAIGTVNATEILECLYLNNIHNCDMFLELGFRERNPDDKNVLSHTKESIDYWLAAGAEI
jgi:hypothetical protein